MWRAGEWLRVSFWRCLWEPLRKRSDNSGEGSSRETRSIVRLRINTGNAVNKCIGNRVGFHFFKEGIAYGAIFLVVAVFDTVRLS